MKKIITIGGAAVAALDIATIPALSASAVTAITQTATSTAAFGDQYSTVLSADGNIQVILDLTRELLDTRFEFALTDKSPGALHV